MLRRPCPTRHRRRSERRRHVTCGPYARVRLDALSFEAAVLPGFALSRFERRKARPERGPESRRVYAPGR